MPFKKQGRFLRSAALRAALFFSADGFCEICGGELERDWQADHSVPWRITHDTNIFEMQASCPRCNRSKGGKVVTTMTGLEGFQPGRLRKGQQEAVRTVISRVTDGQTHTSIVLPTRYGKSDVIRVAGAMLIKNRVTTRCIILEPAIYLVNQITDPGKMADAISNYGLPFTPKELSVYPMLGRFRFESLIADYAPFLAMTTQMATINTKNGILQHLVDYDIRRGNGPPLVFIDEAHTGSSGNAWGSCTRALAEAGASLVMLTATPFRTDEDPVYGFEYVPVRMDAITRYTSEGEMVHEYGGYSVGYKLDADFEYTFDEAWAEEPLPMCVLQHRTFDVEMGEVADEDSDEILSKLRLSELSKSDVDRVLGKLLRHPIVIARGVETFLDELVTLRKEAPKSKGIVFVGNDKGEDFRNAQALKVKAAIADQAPDLDLKVEIATTAIDGGTQAAQARINLFAGGKGADILIVKDMGGVGMDVPALKVGLNLSPVRTSTAGIQRMMRIGTIWPEPEPGHETMFIARWVTPADIKSVQMFMESVHQRGGDAQTIDVEYIRSFLKSPSGGGTLAKTYIPLAGQEGDTLADTEGNTAPSEKLPWIKYVKGQIRRIAYVLSDPQIANLPDMVRDYEGGPVTTAAPPEEVVNIPAEKRKLQAQVNYFVQQIVYVQHPGARGEAYSKPFRKYMTDLKVERCGMAYKELGDYSIRDLQRLVKGAEAWLKELQNR